MMFEPRLGRYVSCLARDRLLLALLLGRHSCVDCRHLHGRTPSPRRVLATWRFCFLAGETTSSPSLLYFFTTPS